LSTQSGDQAPGTPAGLSSRSNLGPQAAPGSSRGGASHPCTPRLPNAGGHPGICQMLDYGLAPDAYWIVMARYVEHMTIPQLNSACTLPTPVKSAVMLRQAAMPTPRDRRPDSCLLTTVPNTCMVFFGNARLVLPLLALAGTGVHSVSGGPASREDPPSPGQQPCTWGSWLRWQRRCRWAGAVPSTQAQLYALSNQIYCWLCQDQPHLSMCIVGHPPTPASSIMRRMVSQVAEADCRMMPMDRPFEHAMSYLQVLASASLLSCLRLLDIVTVCCP
jgi:hypothetical protein